jgi:hypothetical protein
MAKSYTPILLTRWWPCTQRYFKEFIATIVVVKFVPQMDNFVLPNVPIVGIHMQDWQDPHHFPLWYLKTSTGNCTHICQYELVLSLLMLLVTCRGKIKLGSHNLLVITSHHHPWANLKFLTLSPSTIWQFVRCIQPYPTITSATLVIS